MPQMLHSYEVLSAKNRDRLKVSTLLFTAWWVFLRQTPERLALVTIRGVIIIQVLIWQH